MKRQLSPKVALVVILTTLAVAGVGYMAFWAVEPPPPPGQVRPEDAPPFGQGVKPTPGVS